MAVAFSKSVVAFLLAILLCLAGWSPVCVAQQHKSRKSAVKQAQPAAQPAPPPVPLTLEQMPATPPHVAYQQGELTIVAKNSTLGDILRAVRTQTGAAVEIPSNATERVVSQLGPAPARDVLALLLNGSHFNYVLLGSAGNPSSLERVILTPKSGGGVAAEDGVAQSQPDAAQAVTQQQVQMMGANPVDQDGDDMASDDFAEDPADGDAQVDNAAATQVVDPSQPAAGQGVAKTPEQLLQELQQQQQQQQQRMQKLPPGFQIPPNQQPQVPPQQQ